MQSEEYKWHQAAGGKIDAGLWKKPAKLTTKRNSDILAVVQTYNTISINRYCEAIAHLLHSTQKRIVEEIEAEVACNINSKK